MQPPLDMGVYTSDEAKQSASVNAVMRKIGNDLRKNDERPPAATDDPSR